MHLAATLVSILIRLTTVVRSQLGPLRPVTIGISCKQSTRMEMDMLKTALAALALLAIASTPAAAAPCRNAKGKFIKCATAAPAKPVRCKDTKGKFAKCGTAGAKAI